MEKIPLRDIIADDRAQPRVQMNLFVVGDYREALENGAVFPPVVAFQEGEKFWLADGFHRVQAFQEAGRTEIDALVQPGTLRDAILYSCGANATHGERRTNADKRRAVEILLGDEEWRGNGWSWAAKVCAVVPSYVFKVAKELGLSFHNEKIEVTRGSSTYTMDTSRIGKMDRKERIDLPKPKAPVGSGLLPEVREQIKDTALVDAERHKLEQLEKVPEEKQEAVAERLVTQKARTVPEAVRQEVKQELSETPPLPTDKFRVLYADPPWKYSNSGIIGPTDNYGHVERHYPSLSIEELCALPIRELAEENAVLFLWVTSPLLEEAFPVIRAWGFHYKTSFVWDKIKHNFGHYNSVRHEFLLVCTRGSCTPDIPTLYDSVQSIEKTDTHSAKPEEFRSIIEALYPVGRKIELFARREFPGWEVWGNEVSSGDKPVKPI